MSLPLEDQLDKTRLELSLLEAPYESAMKRAKGEDKEWETRKASLIRRICDLLGKYKIGDEPHKAVGIVAEAGVLASELTAPERIISEYRETKAMVSMLSAQAEKVRELKEQARADVENHPWYQRRGA
jgi:ElaB/YqjD/DUF883 family membrane-anchored ribosome-binding protein